MRTEMSADAIFAAATARPDFVWENIDDKCDCIYQRIGYWTNPYLGATLETRLCCVWAELQKEWPQFFRETNAFWDYNEGKWVPEPAAWNGETDMPKALWYRQLARQQGRTVGEIRAEYQHRDSERPRGAVKAEPIPFYLQLGSSVFEVDLGSFRHVEE